MLIVPPGLIYIESMGKGFSVSPEGRLEPVEETDLHQPGQNMPGTRTTKAARQEQCKALLSGELMPMSTAIPLPAWSPALL